jgi:hypothetical protein
LHPAHMLKALNSMTTAREALPETRETPPEALKALKSLPSMDSLLDLDDLFEPNSEFKVHTNLALAFSMDKSSEGTLLRSGGECLLTALKPRYN